LGSSREEGAAEGDIRGGGTGPSEAEEGSLEEEAGGSEAIFRS